MGNRLFGIDITKLIADNIGPGVLPATLVKVTQGARTVGQLAGGMNPTTTSYACKGFVDSKDRRDRDGELVHSGAVTILLIGGTISGGSVAPEIGDRVTIESGTFLIETLDRDPAGATFTLTCKKA